MVSENFQKRLVVICASPLPSNLNMKSLSKLPFLGAQSRQGFWAQVCIPSGMVLDDFSSPLFASMLEPRVAGESIFDILTNAGIKVSTHGLPATFSPAISEPVKDLQDFLEGDDWECLLVEMRNENRSEAFVWDDLGHPDWQKWDKAIENIALGAGSGTTVWVLAMPGKDETFGWIFAGGANVAAAGNPGPVNLQDLPPTILWWLGVEIPSNMEGRILEEIKDVDSEITEDEMDMLTDHLRGLGYLG